MTDHLVAPAVFAALAVHLAVLLAFAVRPRVWTPVIVVNLAVAGIILVALLAAPPTFRLPVDRQIVGAIIAEALVIGLGVAALRGSRFAGAASIAVFIAHLLLFGAATVFFLTFSINRLF